MAAWSEIVVVVVVIVRECRAEVRAVPFGRSCTCSPAELALHPRMIRATVARTGAGCAAGARCRRTGVLLVHPPLCGPRTRRARHDAGFSSPEDAGVFLLRLVVPASDIFVPVGLGRSLRDGEAKVWRKGLQRHEDVIGHQRQIAHVSQAHALGLGAGVLGSDGLLHQVAYIKAAHTFRCRSFVARRQFAASASHRGTVTG